MNRTISGPDVKGLIGVDIIPFLDSLNEHYRSKPQLGEAKLWRSVKPLSSRIMFPINVEIDKDLLEIGTTYIQAWYDGEEDVSKIYSYFRGSSFYETPREKYTYDPTKFDLVTIVERSLGLDVFTKGATKVTQIYNADHILFPFPARIDNLRDLVRKSPLEVVAMYRTKAIQDAAANLNDANSSPKTMSEELHKTDLSSDHRDGPHEPYLR